MGTASQASETHRFDALKIAIGTLLFGGTALVILYDWIGIGGPGLSSAFNGVVYDAVVVCAGFACLVRARAGRQERRAWLALAAAIFAWGAGEIYWTLYIEGNASAPYPSPADVGYLAFYPLAIAGLYLLVRARARELDPRLWMDGLIAALGTGALGAALIFEFVADRTSGSSLQVATTLAYPLGDILLLSLVVASSPSPAGSPDGPGRCCWRAWRRWRLPTSPSPCSPTARRCRGATGSNRST